MPNDHIEVFEGADGQFWWRRQAANGDLLSGGLEGFSRQEDAWRAARRANADLASEDGEVS